MAFSAVVRPRRPRNTLVFSIFIAFATLVMMNLVTGVFVDGAQRIAREEKNQEHMVLCVFRLYSY